MNSGAFSPCFVDCTVPALPDGTHQVDFRATDSTALVEQSPVSRTVTVDTAAPETQIDSGPADGTALGAGGPTFGFSSTGGSGFECSLDGGAFAACGSPATIGGLADGQHAFDVRATDAAGNSDPSPARRTFRIDSQAPESKVKKAKVKGSKATLKFSADEGGTEFECKLDKKDFKPCESPKRYRKLDDGKHKFFVIATDAAGNEEDKAAKAKFDVG